MSKTLIYNGHGITCYLGKNTMINATDMAKAFNKRPNDFLSLRSSKAFIEAFQSDTSNSGITPIATVKGNHRSGIKQGTWFYEDLALKFAGWLNPHFEVWMIKNIKELLLNGKIELHPKFEIPTTFADALELAAKQQREIDSKNTLLKLQQPKVLLAESIECSSDSILIGNLARILKQNGITIGQNRLFEWMRDKGYLLSKGAYRNQPSQKAMEMVLFEVTERTINQPKKDPICSFTTKVTGKGQIYFINKFLKNKEIF